MKIKAFLSFIFLGLLFVSQVVSSNPPMKILIDYGNTRPSGLPTMEAIKALSNKINVQPQELIQFTPYIFPVKPKVFHLGDLDEARPHGVETVPYPFVVVGSERESVEWLQRNKQYLMNAGVRRGLVTEAANADAFKRINNIAESMSITLNLMDADPLTKIFNVDVYPILITKKEVLQ
jgi:integrating conjugative element protein (TIGR03765 family)